MEAWAGEQLLEVLGTGVTIEEDLFEGQSWTMGVVYSLQLQWYCLAVRVLYIMDTCQLEEL